MLSLLRSKSTKYNLMELLHLHMSGLFMGDPPRKTRCVSTMRYFKSIPYQYFVYPYEFVVVVAAGC